MRKTLALAMMAAFALAAPAYAADPPAPANSQQNKMTVCNEKAGEMKGDERKAFMKTCLSAKPAKPESRMAMCNKKTAGMNKDDRAKAQSECMKAT
jgi:hypothetical protein